jgi:hypothetical protein
MPRAQSHPLGRIVELRVIQCLRLWHDCEVEIDPARDFVNVMWRLQDRSGTMITIYAAICSSSLTG